MFLSTLKTVIEKAHDTQVKTNTKHVEELLENITAERLVIYKGVINGEYEIKKGRDWKDDVVTKTMTVKNEEMFSKVVPLFMSLEKMFDVDTIKEIFEFCRKKKNNAYNFSAISRIKLLTNIIFNARQDRLDLPIKEFMTETYAFAETYSGVKCKKGKIYEFIRDFCIRYAENESSDKIKILLSKITMERLEQQFTTMFKCLVNVSRPDKRGEVKLERAELLWDKKEEKIDNPNSCLDGTILDEFLKFMKDPDPETNPYFDSEEEEEEEYHEKTIEELIRDNGFVEDDEESCELYVPDDKDVKELPFT